MTGQATRFPFSETPDRSLGNNIRSATAGRNGDLKQQDCTALEGIARGSSGGSL
jgi:hypothetical protein